MNSTLLKSLVVCGCLGLTAGWSQADTTLFQDNFNSPDSPAKVSGINPEDGINAALTFAGRQSGSLGNLGYIEKGPVNLHSSILGGVLANKNAYNTVNHNFLPDFKGKTLDLTFTILFSTPDKDYAFVNVASLPSVFSNNDADISGENGFGLLFGPGNGQVFVGKTGSTFTYTPDASGINTVVVNFKADAADAAATVDNVMVTVNGAMVGTYALGGASGPLPPALYLTFGSEYDATTNFKQLTVTTP